MMAIQAVGDSAALARAAEQLDRLDGVSAVRRVDAAHPGYSVLSAAARPRAVEAALAELHRLGVPAEDTTVTRMDVVQWTMTKQPQPNLSWTEVVGEAGLVSQPVPRALAYMVVAGVIACYGVVDRNVILIVGAMAISPDLLPTMAAAVGLVGRRWRLAGDATWTFVVGMAVACASAALFAFALNQFNAMPSGFSLSSASAALGGLTHVNSETISVAFGAGVVGMLALETQASSAVGVAISVTTIPAAAYLGVAAGIGDVVTAAGALGVLATNFALLIVGGSGALLVQRAVTGRPHRRPTSSAGPGGLGSPAAHKSTAEQR